MLSNSIVDKVAIKLFVYNIYIYLQDLALNNPQELVGHEK